VRGGAHQEPLTRQDVPEKTTFWVIIPYAGIFPSSQVTPATSQVTRELHEFF